MQHMSAKNIKVKLGLWLMMSAMFLLVKFLQTVLLQLLKFYCYLTEYVIFIIISYKLLLLCYDVSFSVTAASSELNKLGNTFLQVKCLLLPCRFINVLLNHFTTILILFGGTKPVKSKLLDNRLFFAVVYPTVGLEN